MSDLSAPRASKQAPDTSSTPENRSEESAPATTPPTEQILRNEAPTETSQTSEENSEGKIASETTPTEGTDAPATTTETDAVTKTSVTDVLSDAHRTDFTKPEANATTITKILRDEYAGKEVTYDPTDTSPLSKAVKTASIPAGREIPHFQDLFHQLKERFPDADITKQPAKQGGAILITKDDKTISLTQRYKDLGGKVTISYGQDEQGGMWNDKVERVVEVFLKDSDYPSLKTEEPATKRIIQKIEPSQRVVKNVMTSLKESGYTVSSSKQLGNKTDKLTGYEIEKDGVTLYVRRVRQGDSRFFHVFSDAECTTCLTPENAPLSCKDLDVGIPAAYIQREETLISLALASAVDYRESESPTIKNIEPGFLTDVVRRLGLKEPQHPGNKGDYNNDLLSQINKKPWTEIQAAWAAALFQSPSSALYDFLERADNRSGFKDLYEYVYKDVSNASSEEKAKEIVASSDLPPALKLAETLGLKQKEFFQRADAPLQEIQAARETERQKSQIKAMLNVISRGPDKEAPFNDRDKATVAIARRLDLLTDDNLSELSDEDYYKQLGEREEFLNAVVAQNKIAQFRTAHLEVGDEQISLDGLSNDLIEEIQRINQIQDQEDKESEILTFFYQNVNTKNIKYFSFLANFHDSEVVFDRLVARVAKLSSEQSPPQAKQVATIIPIENLTAREMAQLRQFVNRLKDEEETEDLNLAQKVKDFLTPLSTLSREEKIEAIESALSRKQAQAE